jgi:hypothetical protein
MKKFFEGLMVRKRGDKRSSGDHVNRERISSDYVGQGGCDSLTIRFGEEVREKWPFSGQVMEYR